MAYMSCGKGCRGTAVWIALPMNTLLFSSPVFVSAQVVLDNDMLSIKATNSNMLFKPGLCLEQYGVTAHEITLMSATVLFWVVLVHKTLNAIDHVHCLGSVSSAPQGHSRELVCR